MNPTDADFPLTEEDFEYVGTHTPEAYPDPTPTESKTAFDDINKLYAMAKEFAKEVEKAEAALADAKARHRLVVEDQLPKIMADMGVTSFTSADGTKIEVVKHLENSIPAARKKEAIEWLIAHDHADVIKSEVGVTFPVKEREAAKSLMAKLAVTYGGQVGIAEWVEPATCKAVLRKRLEAGESVPMDLFGARSCDVAKFTEPKRKSDVL